MSFSQFLNEITEGPEGLVAVEAHGRRICGIIVQDFCSGDSMLALAAVDTCPSTPMNRAQSACSRFPTTGKSTGKRGLAKARASGCLKVISCRAFARVRR